MSQSQVYADQQNVITSSGNTVSRIYGAPVNNSLLDPLQGFDADVWCVDQATGMHMLVGRFTSLQITVRNATEPYLEFNQRVPRLLDGEFQMGWVLERGLLDVRVLEQTFGFSAINREMRISRSPRFQITFEMHAPELHTAGISAPAIQNTNGELILGAGRMDYRRQAKGRYMLTFCKVDSWTLGAMAGRSVIANQWQGLCEGIEYISDQTVESWAGTTLNTTASGNNAFRRVTPGTGAEGMPQGPTSNPRSYRTIL